MKWTELDEEEQQMARDRRARLAKAGVGTSVSQIATHWDAVSAWVDGRKSLDDLKKVITWEPTQPAQ